MNITYVNLVVPEIALVTARLGQFQQLLKSQVILILNFIRPHAITYTSWNNQFETRLELLTYCALHAVTYNRAIKPCQFITSHPISEFCGKQNKTEQKRDNWISEWKDELIYLRNNYDSNVRVMIIMMIIATAKEKCWFSYSFYILIKKVWWGKKYI